MKFWYYAGWSLTRALSTFPFFIKVSGRGHIPASGGFILATNHASYFDPLLAGSWSTREMYFFAKKELFRNSLFGWLITQTNAIPINRGAIDREGIERAVQVVHAGHGLLIFPEGTRGKGEQFLSPKPGLGMVARAAGCAIVPGYLHGTHRLMDCLLQKTRMRIVFGEPIGTDWVRSQAENKEGYLAIATETMRRIELLRRE